MKKINKILLFVLLFLVVLGTLIVLDIKRNLILSFNSIDISNLKILQATVTVGVKLDITNDTFLNYNIRDLSAFVYNDDSGDLIGTSQNIDLIKINKGYNSVKIDIDNVSVSQNIDFVNTPANLRVVVFLKVFGITNSIEQVINI
jgi:hypothetical protein